MCRIVSDSGRGRRVDRLACVLTPSYSPAKRPLHSLTVVASMRKPVLSSIKWRIHISLGSASSDDGSRLCHSLLISFGSATRAGPVQASQQRAAKAGSLDGWPRCPTFKVGGNGRRRTVGLAGSLYPVAFSQSIVCALSPGFHSHSGMKRCCF